MPGGGTADAGFRAKGVPMKMVWVGLAAVLLLCFGVFKWAIPAATNKFLAPAIDPAHEMAKTRAAKALSVSSVQQAPEMPSMPRERPKAVPYLTGVWTDIVAGQLEVHAILEDGSTIPPAWITAYNLNDYPAAWVEARGVRFYFKTSRQRAYEKEQKRLLTMSQESPFLDSNSTNHGPEEKTNSEQPTGERRPTGFLAQLGGPNLDAR